MILGPAPLLADTSWGLVADRANARDGDGIYGFDWKR